MSDHLDPTGLAVRDALLRAPMDPDLPDRLLARVRRRRRTAVLRASSGLVVAAAVVAAAVVLAPGREDRLVPATASQDRVSISEAGAVTSEQAARAGLDGRPQCESEQVRGQVMGPGRVYAGYLTDTRGYYETFSPEYFTLALVPGSGPLVEDGLVAVCWYAGEFVDGSAGGPVDTFGSQLRAQHLDAGWLGSSASVDALPVLAPPPPAPGTPGLTAAIAAQGSVVHPQPEGVPVVDQLVARTPEPRADGVDCSFFFCGDPGEPPVRVDVTADGMTTSGEIAVVPGQRVEVVLRLEVAEGYEVRDVFVDVGPFGRHRVDGALSPGAVALDGQPGPVTGLQEYRAVWTVPDVQELYGLHLEYSFTLPDGSARTSSPIWASFVVG